MNTVLLVYVLLAHEHRPPTHPKFFAMYRTQAACEMAAKRYMEFNGKADILINAKCADARDPALVQHLRNVKEVEAIKDVGI